MRIKNRVMECDDIARAISRIAYEVLEKNDVANLVVIGIHTRGVNLADRICKKILQLKNVAVPMGILDITPFRDDNKERGKQNRTNIAFDVTDKNVLIADDVLFTGRTVRAALDAIKDLGRPLSVQLAVLVDRGHRELPIKPDFVGKNIPTAKNEVISVCFEELDKEDSVAILTME